MTAVTGHDCSDWTCTPNSNCSPVKFQLELTTDAYAKKAPASFGYATRAGSRRRCRVYKKPGRSPSNSHTRLPTSDFRGAQSRRGGRLACACAQRMAARAVSRDRVVKCSLRKALKDKSLMPEVISVMAEPYRKRKRGGTASSSASTQVPLDVTPEAGTPINRKAGKWGKSIKTAEVFR